LDLYVLNFDKFGKNVPKACRVSPDAFVQLAMQLAFFRTHEKLGNAYESGSLRKFHLGRTDIIRTASSDVAEFLNAIKTNVSQSEKSRLLLKAINSHRQYTVNVLNCESFDRHLLGLKLTALENKIELPELYKDIGFQKACHYFISSSQVSSKYDAVTSYGPLADDGYGNFV
jgi:carnitine O-acetyltransferase